MDMDWNSLILGLMAGYSFGIATVAIWKGVKERS